MRSPLARHTLAVLRHTIGPDMTQMRMAQLVGRATATIKKIELNQLALAASLASEIAARTGVNLEWLVENDIRPPIIDAKGKPYTKETFERVQLDSELHSNSYTLPQIVEDSVTKVTLAGFAAQKSNQQNAIGLFGYRIGKSIDAVANEVEGYRDLKAKWDSKIDQVGSRPSKSATGHALELLKDYPETVNHLKSTVRELDQLGCETSKTKVSPVHGEAGTSLAVPRVAKFIADLKCHPSITHLLQRWGSDPFFLIVTGHFIIEHLLEGSLSRLLNIELIHARTALESLSFGQKLQLLISMIQQHTPKLNTSPFLAINTLNDLRNKLVHSFSDQQGIERDLQDFLTEYRRTPGVPRLPAGSSAKQFKAALLELFRLLSDAPLGTD